MDCIDRSQIWSASPQYYWNTWQISCWSKHKISRLRDFVRSYYIRCYVHRTWIFSRTCLGTNKWPFWTKYPDISRDIAGHWSHCPREVGIKYKIGNLRPNLSYQWQVSGVKLPLGDCHWNSRMISQLFPLMALCRQATSRYLSQCWPNSMSPHVVTRPQWVNSLAPGKFEWNLDVVYFLNGF